MQETHGGVALEQCTVPVRFRFRGRSIAANHFNSQDGPSPYMLDWMFFHPLGIPRSTTRTTRLDDASSRRGARSPRFWLLGVRRVLSSTKHVASFRSYVSKHIRTQARCTQARSTGDVCADGGGGFRFIDSDDHTTDPIHKQT
jgi:hypothetical protein